MSRNLLKLHIKNRRVFKIALLATFIIVFTSFLHLLELDSPFYDVMLFLFSFFVYMGLIASWGISVRKRIINRKVRIHLLIITGLMVYSFFMRSVRYRIFVNCEVLSRYAWYSYYIAFLFMPLVGFWSSLYVGETEDYRMKTWHKLLLIPTGLICLGIFTNEYHQWAFRFPKENWSGLYTRGGLYYLALVWIISLTGATIFILLDKSKASGQKTRVHPPLMIVGIGLLYSILYMVNSSRRGFGFIELIVMFTALSISLWETYIQARLIPSNADYVPFFKKSSFATQIVDREGKPYYKSDLALDLDGKTIDELIRRGLVNYTEQIQLHAAPIKGGYVFWQEDVSYTKSMVEELYNLGEELKNKADLLNEEYQIRSQEIKIRERIRIYNLLATKAQKQLRKIMGLIEAYPKLEQACQRAYLLRINSIGVYVKRRCNLVLMAEAQEEMTSRDLYYSIKESLDSLKLWGVESALLIGEVHGLNPDEIMLCYDFFEEVLEATFDHLENVFVVLKEGEAGFVFTVQIKTKDDLAQELEPLLAAERLGLVADLQIMDDLIYSLSLQKKEGGKVFGTV